VALKPAPLTAARGRLVLALAISVGAACAHGNEQFIVWHRPFPPVTQYAAEPTPQPAFVDAHFSPELAKQIELAADARGIALQGDGRLVQIARLLAGRKDASAPPPARLLELAASQLGVFDPGFDVIIIPAPPDLAKPLSAALTRHLTGQVFTHYGALVLTRGAQRWLTLVLSERRLRLAPVPRALALGQPIRLQGQLPEGFAAPRVDALIDGKRLLLPLGSDRDFSVQLPAARAGLQRIEILGDDRLGGVVLAKLAIYVGMAAPRDIVLPRHERGYDPRATADAVFASLNRERAKANLPALIRDSRLDVLAAAHSVDMRDHGFLGHTSPRSGTPERRVSQAGLSTALVLETIARGADGTALEASAAVPPAELRNLLSPGVTHVGIGISALPDPHGPTLVATELFARLAEPLELSSATPRLLALINQARVQRGASTLALDSSLVAVAERAAARFGADLDPSTAGVLADMQREFNDFSLVYHRVNALITRTARLEDAATLEPALNPAADRIGIGIARTRDELLVVLAVGTRH
jgi:uncharacterized protein YkwD